MYIFFIALHCVTAVIPYSHRHQPPLDMISSFNYLPSFFTDTMTDLYPTKLAAGYIYLININCFMLKKVRVS